ncbi:UNVERIFIED_CONTAM: Zinc finger CCCH domain-containing protein 65 [Sesamum radiatum]|uniref:Zinc finger CCCH domain-containing protein 65 n=1 Tax=Sesamum radiatum TaxID=300843 RepID=A0AAW2R2Q5_SESRA
MEDSSQLQTLTRNPSETTFSFPPHRRRPLRSRTYCNLIEIFSHCGTNFPQHQTQACQEVNPIDALVPLPSNEESKDSLAQEASVGKNKEQVFEDGGFEGKQAALPNLDHIRLLTDGEQEVIPENRNNVGDFLVDENQASDSAISDCEDRENGKVNDIVTLEQLEVDEAFSIQEFSEVLDGCFGVDMVIGSSKAGEDRQENVTVVENLPKEAEHELKLKEMELENLIYNSGVMGSSCQINADEEIEEGEISGEAGIADASLDALSEDAVSLGERTTEMVHASEDSFDKEEFICNDGVGGRGQHEISDPSLVNLVNSDSNCREVESRTSTGKMQDCHSQNVFHDNNMKTQRSGPVAPSAENPTPSGRNVQEDAAENRTPATTEQDGSASKKKRKHGPLTKEKRAKKKKKERLKRAEKNRKLGVKRLKLQPVLKPKTKVYCRHYLQGRCHEGEKCKFSHDTVPLTKSKPCGHFARHSCMKGDDCPFDHQLSKYPCNNYASNGFCSRGSDCLFSHEILAKQSLSKEPNVSKSELTSAQHIMPDKGGSVAISKITKPEVKFPSPLNNSNSSKHTDNNSSQKINSKFCSVGDSGNGAELLAPKPVPRPAGQAPKGVSFLLNAGTTLGNASKHTQDGSCVKRSDGVDAASNTMLKVPGSFNKTNEIFEGLAPRKPRGINFLSFAQPRADDSSSKALPDFIANRKSETGKSVMDDG